MRRSCFFLVMAVSGTGSVGTESPRRQLSLIPVVFVSLRVMHSFAHLFFQTPKLGFIDTLKERESPIVSPNQAFNLDKMQKKSRVV